MDKKTLLQKVRAIFAGTDTTDTGTTDTGAAGGTDTTDTGDGKTKDGSNIINYSVDNGSAVYDDISNDNLPGIDVGDEVFTDEAMTTPYPDGTFTVTGTEFTFTVANGKVTAVTDPNNTGAGTPNAAAAPTTTDTPDEGGATDDGFAAIVAEAFKAGTPSGAAYENMLNGFATGTPEERIANLETVCKALMEYTFGWKIQEAQRKATEDAAIAIYNNDLNAVQTMAAKHEKILPEMFALVEAIAEVPTTNPKTLEGNKKERFDRTNKREKTLERIADNVAAMRAHN